MGADAATTRLLRLCRNLLDMWETSDPRDITWEWAKEWIDRYVEPLRDHLLETYPLSDHEEGATASKGGWNPAPVNPRSAPPTVWRTCRVCKGQGEWCWAKKGAHGYGSYKRRKICERCNGQGYVLGPADLPKEEGI